MIRSNSSRRVFSLLVVLLISVIALNCSDDQDPTRTPSTPVVINPPSGPHIVAALRGDVDVLNGTMSFTPIEVPAGHRMAGPNYAIYGNQGTTVRLYNTTTGIRDNAPSAGQSTDSAWIGIRNMLPHTIGDEQDSLETKLDTMGIYVYFSSGPTATSGSGSVSLNNQHGTLAFDAPNQKYFWYRSYLWREIGGVARADGRDTTVNVGVSAPTSRIKWRFVRQSTVLNYSFTVLISAPWPKPYETSWKVDWQGDSLPNLHAAGTYESEPYWDSTRTTAGSHTTTLVSTSPTYVQYSGMVSGNRREIIRKDTIADSLFLEVRLSDSTTSGGANDNIPNAFFGFNTDSRFVAFGLNRSQIGVINNTYNGFATTPARVTVPCGSVTPCNSARSTAPFHVYKVVKRRTAGIDSVLVFIDGGSIPLIGEVLSAFPADADAAARTYFLWGHIGVNSSNPGRVTSTSWMSRWDYVIYKIGATQ
jgi:hypothetical protein